MYRRRRNAVLITASAYQPVGVPQPTVGYIAPQPSYYPPINAQQQGYAPQQYPQQGYQPPVAQAYPAQRV